MSLSTSLQTMTESLQNGPPPGGGSVAAVYGSLAIALVQMLAPLANAEPDLRAQAKRLEESLRALAAEDEAILKELLPFFSPGRPLGDEAQPVIRRAAQVPLAIAADCLAALRLCEALAKRLPSHALADLSVAAGGAYSGVKGAALISLTNAPLLAEESKRDAVVARLRALLKEASAQRKKINLFIEEQAPYRLLRP
ncbi:cyclodeaminase/cyclohydrolase family protein [Azotosporobacter soli]|uniref:cyclodeaminase/cyclohydrolase family protein n=1 Tax=Azotosporobacter soli TaxID=3055040 RepID=UPI0031FE885A